MNIQIPLKELFIFRLLLKIYLYITFKALAKMTHSGRLSYLTCASQQNRLKRNYPRK